VADRFAVGIKYDRVGSTIADDRAVTSVQDVPLAFVPGDELSDGLAHLRRSAPGSFALHGYSPSSAAGHDGFLKNE
jgi:hypothetical protein